MIASPAGRSAARPHAERGVDASVETEGLLKDPLQTYEIRDAREAVPIDKPGATNDEKLRAASDDQRSSAQMPSMLAALGQT